MRSLPNHDALAAEARTALGEQIEALLVATPMRFGTDLRGALPQDPGVYRVALTGINVSGSLYVGQSKHLRNRVWGDHVKGDRRGSTVLRKLISSGRATEERSAVAFLFASCHVQFITVQGERMRRRLEHYAIALLDPELND